MTSDVFFVQQNFTVGNLAGNTQLILDAAAAAAAAGCAVVLTPENALSGYPAEDLLYSSALRLSANGETLTALAAALPPQLAVLVGTPILEDSILYNGSALLRGGKVEAVYKKCYLPNYSVFDEKRYFQPHDNPPLVFEAGGRRYAVQICEDVWHTAQRKRLAVNADAILVQNGSPFFTGKHLHRQQTAAAVAAAADAAVYYANLTGGQDELVFDGASFAVDKNGALIGQLPAFSTCNSCADTCVEYPDDTAAIYQALITGIRDYVFKSRFARGALLGLSGGIDSALVAALATEALGSGNLCAVMMPSAYTSDTSRADARTLADNLGIEYLSLPLTDSFAALSTTINPHLRPRDRDVTYENMQSRLRGTLLMSLANNRDLLLLATGNKSELACGYATLYGDMNGGFAPIKDVLKTQVWELARYYNRTVAAHIPERTITRAPSAELRPEQTDEDTLPPYPVLDAIIRDHLLHCPRRQMEAAHGNQAVGDFYRLLQASEYKRRQAPPGTKISACGFGRDWRMPAANGYASYA